MSGIQQGCDKVLCHLQIVLGSNSNDLSHLKPGERRHGLILRMDTLFLET